MHPVIAILDLVINIYSTAVFIYVLIQLLAHFNILNTNQSAVIAVTRFLGGIIEPVLIKIRRYVKPYNNMDFSPLVLLIGLYAIQYCLRYYFI